MQQGHWIGILAYIYIYTLLYSLIQLAQASSRVISDHLAVEEVKESREKEHVRPDRGRCSKHETTLSGLQSLPPELDLGGQADEKA